MVTECKVFTDYYRQSCKKVKNLTWLLRHWKNVKEFRVYTKDLTNKSDDAILIAEMLDGKIYETGFASKQVLKAWLCRPVFYGLVCTWDNIKYKIEKGV